MFTFHSRSAPRADETTQERLVSHPSTFPMCVEREEHQHQRSAAPAEKPLPRTLRWVASLPPKVRPTALLRRYARIANVIAATWGHPTSLRSYMDCLFSATRANRRGFPLEVVSELIALKRYHDNLYAQ
jgi:hypothetical protein